MKIETGRGTIPLITLLAIWSISLVVNLPGLAVSPILSNIKSVFPSASELEVQLITILPNLLIIPFILLSGRLSVSRDKVGLLIIGLIIYLASGILYFIARTMPQLIIISCLLGIGSGLVIPIAAGFIADYFTGKYRMQQLGIKSGIANIALVGATFAVGMLAKINWHMPFIVYLTPIIPLALSPYLSKRYRKSNAAAASVTPTVASSPKSSSATEPGRGIDWKKLGGLMALYGVVTYATCVVNFYFPFLATKYRVPESSVGIITALFFTAIMIPGFILPAVIKLFKKVTIPAALFFVVAGLFMGYASRNAVMFGISSFIMGFGYGTIQPIIYDKAVDTAPGARSTLALSLVLAANYLAVTLAPFIVDFFKFLFHIQGNLFPYLLNGIISALMFALSIIMIKGFPFSVNKEYT